MLRSGRTTSAAAKRRGPAFMVTDPARHQEQLKEQGGLHAYLLRAYKLLLHASQFATTSGNMSAVTDMTCTCLSFFRCGSNKQMLPQRCGLSQKIHHNAP